MQMMLTTIRTDLVAMHFHCLRVVGMLFMSVIDHIIHISYNIKSAVYVNKALTGERKVVLWCVYATVQGC